MIYYRHTDLLLSLLRLALWGDREPFESLRPIGEEEWRVAFNLAASHTVVGLAWQGICMLEEEELPSQELLCVWAAKSAKIEQASDKMNSVLSSLMTLFHDNGLNPIVMKGQCVASLYDKPSLRECGDIDLYLGKEEFGKSRNMLGKSKRAADGCYRSIYKSVEVEMHPRYIDICNPFAQSAIRRIIEEKGSSQVEIAPGLAVTGLAPEVNLLSLSAHIMKHSFGRGIGLRQMCDLAMACKRYHGTIDGEFVARTAKSLGLRKWNRQVYSFLVLQLGMDAEYLPYPIALSKSQVVTERVLYGGNFGRMVYDENGKGKLAHKGETVWSMVKNSFWTLGCAPMEWLSYFTKLAFGQFRR